MWRSYLIAALRNLARNPLYAAIGIVSLTVGICAAVLTSLVIRNQMTFDRFIPGFERTYLAAIAVVPMGRAPEYSHPTPSFLAGLLTLQFSEIESITRINEQEVNLRHGGVEANENIYWADPNTFDVLPLPVFAGDLKTALRRPDGIVLTRSVAKKFFGREDALGLTVQVDGEHSMTITAVVEDLPPNGTQLHSGIFASGLASFSTLSADDNNPDNKPGGSSMSLSGTTYVRLAPGASIERMQAAMPQFIAKLWPSKNRPPGLNVRVDFIRLDKVNLFSGLNPGITSRLTVAGAIGLLILIISCVVFVNLATARSTRRAVEVAVRKSSGASRLTLLQQFLGEAFLYVLLATCIAIALTELLLPSVNAFLNSGISFNYWRDPSLLGWIILGTAALALITGAYPALILCAFRPASVLRGLRARASGSTARRALVAIQFAILIALIIAAIVIRQQRVYATNNSLRVNTEQLLLVRSACNDAFKQRLRALPGVRGVSCSSDSLLTAGAFGNFKLKDGSMQAIDLISLEPGTFDLYGVKPLAGEISATVPGPARFIINETAARRFGFDSPTAAVGHSIPIVEGSHGALRPGEPNEIGAVIRDFSIGAIEQKIRPAIYYPESNPHHYGLINIKLTGHSIPETLTQIDQAWTELGLLPPATLHNRSRAANTRQPIERFFLDDHIQNLYLSILREAQALSTFSGLAVLLACLGLVGLTAATLERRTKEVGIRKAMGSGTREIMRLLLWEFSKPILWANIIAWPLAWYCMSHWLDRFAYHIEIELWLFPAAGATALAIALITVSAQAFLIARAKPAESLRHE